MSGKPRPPCHHCPQRAPGCHNGQTCPAWGRYAAELAAYHQVERARIQREAIYEDYRAAHRPDRRRKKTERGSADA